MLHLHKSFSTATSSETSWRTLIKQTQLVSQISSILIQRNNWIPLLENLNLSKKLTPSVFLQILYKTQNEPRISLDFFNWAISHLKFKPDLKSQCYFIQVCVGSGLVQPARKILDSLVQTHHANVILETMVDACRGKNHKSEVLNVVLQSFSGKGLFIGGLEVYKRMRFISIPSVHACNALLGSFERENKTKLAWCFYGSMIRIEVLPNKVTWSLIAQILYKDMNFEKIVNLLDMGICNSFMYNAVIDYYSRNGNFEGAFYRLNEMSDRQFAATFITYSSILDGACKFGEAEVIERVISTMVEKGLLPNPPFSKSDSIIKKFCNLGKVNAATMFLNRACDDEKIGLQDTTYGYMLKAFSEHGKGAEAIGLYRVISERAITVNDRAYIAFADFLCCENHSEERFLLLKDILKRGFSPNMSTLSKFIMLLCNDCRWREAEELLNLVLAKGSLPDSLACCSLVKHYCSSKQVDKAVELHNRLEKLLASLDVTSYNALLDGLFAEGRLEESIRVFEYMKGLKLVDSASFTSMIRGLCRAKEMRNAMKLHDQMLDMELKPDKVTYKMLIQEFNQ